MENLILQEAFQQLNMLNEEDFNISNNSEEGIEELKDFEENDDALDVLDVIDPEAETEEELEDSYINKVILDCTVCHSKIYKDKEDINIDETADLANVGEECPYCYSSDGYTVIGQVVPFSETEVDVEIEPKDDELDIEEIEEEPIEDDLEESCGKKSRKKKMDDESLKEGLEKLDIETEHDNIHIQAEEKIDADAEMLAPLSPTVEDEIMGVEEEPFEDTSMEDVPEDIPEDALEEPEDEYTDYDLEDFDEESFDELGESYLRKVYENVVSYKSTSVKTRDNTLFVEGLIKFTSGNTKKTQFIFEAKDASKNNKVRFVGRNPQINESKSAFTLSGKFSGTKFISESLKYAYRQKTNEGFKRVSGKSNLKLQEATAYDKLNLNSVPAFADFWINQYERRIENAEKQSTADKNPVIHEYLGRIEILKALRDSGLTFSSPAMNARTLATALEGCNGTVGSFLREFSACCGDTYLDRVEKILSPLA